MKNRKPRYRFVFLVSLLAVINISCQKVVNVDLNSAAPRIVIEANISDNTGACQVSISHSVSYDQDNTFPPVSGASLSLAFDSGSFHGTARVSEFLPGLYATEAASAEPGYAYTLTVVADGNTYVAKSTMPPPVPIDTLSVENISLGFESRQVIVIHFKDPASVKNYYHIVEYDVNRSQESDFAVDDRAQDGNEMNVILFRGDDTLYAGDHIRVDLECVDKNMYDYFIALYQAVGGNGPQSASPTNPPTNFSGGALGYFSAYADVFRFVTVPPVAMPLSTAEKNHAIFLTSIPRRPAIK